jgi:hypothetical protein
LEKYPKGKFFRYVTKRGHPGKKPRALARGDSFYVERHFISRVAKKLLF